MTTVFSKPLGDEVKALSDQIQTQYDSTALTSLDGIKTFLNTVNGSLSDNQWKEIRFNIGSTTIAQFGSSTSYSGRITRNSSTSFVCEVLGTTGRAVRICRYNDYWRIKDGQMSSNADISDCNNAVNGQSYNITSSTQNRPFDWGILFQIGTMLDNGGYKTQFAVDTSGTKLAIRATSSSSWSAWKTINLS